MSEAKRKSLPSNKQQDDARLGSQHSCCSTEEEEYLVNCTGRLFYAATPFSDQTFVPINKPLGISKSGLFTPSLVKQGMSLFHS